MKSNSVEFFADDTWVVPDDVNLIHLLLIGGGAGGGGSREASNRLSAGGGGGGAGEMCISHPVHVTAGDTVTIAIGAKGTGGLVGSSSGSPQFPQAGSAGGATIITLASGFTFRAAGGRGGASAIGGGDSAGGQGGGFQGGDQAAGIDGAPGRPEGMWTWTGGPGGGGYRHAPSHAGITAPRIGGPAPGTGPTPAGATDSITDPGGPGAAHLFGIGGAPGDGLSPNTNWSASAAPANHWGAGGGGGGTDQTIKVAGYYVDNGRGSGADGEHGYAMIYWMQPD